MVKWSPFLLWLATWNKGGKFSQHSSAMSKVGFISYSNFTVALEWSMLHTDKGECCRTEALYKCWSHKWWLELQLWAYIKIKSSMPSRNEREIRGLHSCAVVGLFVCFSFFVFGFWFFFFFFCSFWDFCWGFLSACGLFILGDFFCFLLGWAFYLVGWPFFFHFLVYIIQLKGDSRNRWRNGEGYRQQKKDTFH